MPPSKKTTRSGNPAVRAQAEADEKYQPRVWGSGSSSAYRDLECPSGQVALVRRPGVEALLKAGVLHDVDTLTQLVREQHIEPSTTGKTTKSLAESRKEISELLQDPSKLDNVLHTMDRILCYAVVKPEVLMTPDDVTRRQPGAVYADMVSLEDKVFIMNYAVGGSADLERFRREFDESVGRLDNVEDAEDPTFRAVPAG